MSAPSDARPPAPVGAGGRVVLYRDKLGEWRWSDIADNNRVVADSGEGYDNRGYAALRAAIQAHGRLVVEAEGPGRSGPETILIDPAVVVDVASIEHALGRLASLDQWLGAVAATPLLPPSPKSCNDQRANIADAVLVLRQLGALP